MLSRLTSLARRQPLAFGIGVSAVKTTAADGIAQLYLERRPSLDRRRSAIFALWGAGYLGAVQYFIYVHLFARVLFPTASAFVAKPLAARLADRAGQLTVVKQVALDQFVHHPFVLFPAFYCVKESIECGALGREEVRSAMAKYRTNIAQDCAVCWTTWIPAFLFNFSVCPLWGRIPFVAAVPFGFMTYFSFLRGGPQVEESSERRRTGATSE